MNKALVIGESGLLGSHLRVELLSQGVKVFSSALSFNWLDTEVLITQFASVIDSFAKTVNADEAWAIFWAAGAGTMHSTEQDLQHETLQFNECVHVILNSGLNLRKGALIFASSAGAVYAGCKESLINEHSPVAPINVYGFEKLKQEKILEKIAYEHPEFTILINRISTLYGVRKKPSSRPGLLAQISRNIVLGQPIHVFVPLETMRDYMHAQDAAKCIIKTIENMQNKAGGIFIKIVANEKSHSVAEILSLFKKVSHKSIRLIHYRIPSSIYYKKIIQFRSVNIEQTQNIQKRNLLIGIAQLLASERIQCGSLVRAEYK